MIDEIPVRDHPLPKKQASPFSLGHLAILFGLAFIVLLVLLLCSKGLDFFASKIWPKPSSTLAVSTSTKPGAASAKQRTTIEIPIASSPSLQPQPDPASTGPSISMPSQSRQTAPSLSEAPSMISSSDVSTVSTSVSSPSDVSFSQTADSYSSSPSSLAAPSFPEEVAAFSAVLASDLPNALEQNPISSVAPASAPNLADPPLAEATEPNKPPEAVSLPSKPSAAVTPKPENSKQRVADKKALKVQMVNPNHYTVQVMGRRDQKQLCSFIEKNHLKKKVKIYKTTSQGKAWYVAVYGDFKSREEALKAASRLPTEVKKQQPWIRSMASLQEFHRVTK